MSEMTNLQDIDPAKISATIVPEAVKGRRTETDAELALQADEVRRAVVAVDYEQVRGTCGDERERESLLSGESTEPRPSIFGGPDIYGLYIAEGTGYFEGMDELDPAQRLGFVKQQLNRNGVKSGGHVHCAAAGKFGGIIEIIDDNKIGIKSYAQTNMGDSYDDELMDEVLNNFTRTRNSKRYENWDGEAALKEVLDDEAGKAIEVLADVPHTGKTLIRNNIPGTTVDQTRLHKRADKDSFVHDEAYASFIENSLSSGPQAARVKRLMEHAREAVLFGVAGAVPNQEINQINLSL